MNCTKCGSDEVEHDCENIYCYNCGYVEKYVDRSEIKPFTAPILCMLSSIPILNLLMYLIAHIKKKKKYKDLILANILLCFMGLMILILGVITPSRSVAASL